MSKDFNGLEKVGAFVIAVPMVLTLVILMLPLGIFNAWAVQKMYIWFLLPLGWPSLNLWHVFGITLLISHFKGVSPSSDKSWQQSVIGALFGTLLMLGVGLIIRGWIY